LSKSITFFVEAAAACSARSMFAEAFVAKFSKHGKLEIAYNLPP
jgi:hypothetical protein